MSAGTGPSPMPPSGSVQAALSPMPPSGSAPPSSSRFAPAAGFRCPGQPRRSARGDTGSATVLVLALCAVLVVAGGLTAGLGSVAVSRHRAAAAADLAALAGAQAVGNGGPACPAAVRVALSAGAELASCASEGADVVVEAVVRPAGPLGRLGVARVRARAGPSRAPG